MSEDKNPYRDQLLYRNDVKNTTAAAKGPSGLAMLMEATASGTSAMIEAQEATGQKQFVKSEILPVRGTDGADGETWRKMGVLLGEPVQGDELFRHVTLPAGWKKERTDHSMWSNLLDDKGRIRASIFYKAAFYDRDAFMHVKRRFDVLRNYGEADYDRNVVVYVVKDGDQVVFRTPPSQLPVGVEGQPFRRALDAAELAGEKACKEWLLTNGFPNWEDNSAYWD